MNNISYVQATTSCLPVIGPVVGLYSKGLVDAKISSYDTLRASARSNFEGYAHQMQTQLDHLDAQSSKDSQIGRTYSVCAIVGNLSTVALVVNLIGLGILSYSAPATVVMLACTALGGMHSIDYAKHSKGSRTADELDHLRRTFEL